LDYLSWLKEKLDKITSNFDNSLTNIEDYVRNYILLYNKFDAFQISQGLPYKSSMDNIFKAMLDYSKQLQESNSRCLWELAKLQNPKISSKLPAIINSFNEIKQIHRIRVPQPNSDYNWGAHLISDGTKIATASDNNLITIWDSVKSKRLRQIRGHTDGVRDLIQLQNGKLASNSSIEIIIWNLFSGKPILIIKNPGNFCCILEAASNILVAGGESGITFWKLGSLEIGATRVLKSIQQGCTSIVCIRYQGIACAAGTQIYVYRYYHPLTWENDNTILQHTNPVYALVFLDKSNTLISGDTGGI